MKKTTKIILDTHCFIHFWTSNDECYSYIFNEIVAKAKARLLFSQETIGELMYLIKTFSNKQDISEDDCLSMLKELSQFFYDGKSVNTKYINMDFCKDPDDDMFLEVALAGNADYVISDDRKSGIHKYNYGRFKVMTSVEFVNHWKNKHSNKS